MTVVGGEPQANLRRSLEWIARAAADGARIAVLPEAMTLGWTHSSARALAEEIPDGESCAALRRAARQHNIFICSGLIEKSGRRIFNSAVLIAPDGGVILHHRKIHELDLARGLYSPGDRLAVAETELGRIGLMICADGFAPGQVLGRSLGNMGARLILSPCAWAVPAEHDNAHEPYGKLWMDNYSPVAREFGLWIVGVSNVGWINDGPWQGRKCIGCSLVVGPSGEKVLQGPYGVEAEALLRVDLDLRPRGEWDHAGPAE
jgi:predicted amidohydrolase